MFFVFMGIVFSVGGPPGTMLFVFRFYLHSLFGRPSGGHVFCFSFLRGAVLDRRSSGTMFFCFAFLPAAFGNWRPPVAPSFVARRKIGEKGVPRGCGPLNPRGNVLGHSDVLCANRLAMVRLTRLSRAWRAPHCFHALCVLRCQGYGNAYDFTGHRSTHESVEAVRSTPRTGLNRVNCTRAHT